MARAGLTDIVLYRRLARLARPEWGRIGIFGAVSLAAVPLTLLTPLPLKIAVDSGIGSDEPPAFVDALMPTGGSQTAVLVVAALLFVAVALLTQLQQFASAALGAYTGERLLLRLRSELFKHVQRLSLSYHDKRGTADSTYRIQYDAMSIQWITVTGLVPFVVAIVTVVGMVYVTARIDVQLALVALTVAPMLFALTSLYRWYVRRRWHEAKQLDTSALSVVQEVLTGLRVVKAFGQEQREHQRFLRASSKGMLARVRLAMLQGLFGGLIGLTVAAGYAAVLYIGARRVQAGALSLGDLLVVMSYLTQLYAPLQIMSKTVGKLQESMAGAERALALLDEAPDVPESRHARPLQRTAGAIAMRDVCFEYRRGWPILQAVSFEAQPGARVGIIGATGAGKTTLISLLARFYDPTSGMITLDGVDLRDYRVADVRGQFAIVLQEPVLFSTTIFENIAYARADADLDDIVHAAQAANAHEFIEQLPQGYDTVVGERGMMLSGGERQRISLARAFLKDAPILVVDEPTSSVDRRTEALILTAMERLMEGRTTFMIAHRQGTLAGCTLRLHLKDGRVRVTKAARRSRSPRRPSTAAPASTRARARRRTPTETPPS